MNVHENSAVVRGELINKCGNISSLSYLFESFLTVTLNILVILYNSWNFVMAYFLCNVDLGALFNYCIFLLFFNFSTIGGRPSGDKRLLLSYAGAAAGKKPDTDHGNHFEFVFLYTVPTL